MSYDFGAKAERVDLPTLEKKHVFMESEQCGYKAIQKANDTVSIYIYIFLYIHILNIYIYYYIILYYIILHYILYIYYHLLLYIYIYMRMPHVDLQK